MVNTKMCHHWAAWEVTRRRGFVSWLCRYALPVGTFTGIFYRFIAQGLLHATHHGTVVWKYCWQLFLMGFGCGLIGMVIVWFLLECLYKHDIRQGYIQNN